jgi:hypothetical protein
MAQKRTAALGVSGHYYAFSKQAHFAYSVRGYRCSRETVLYQRKPVEKWYSTE